MENRVKMCNYFPDRIMRTFGVMAAYTTPDRAGKGSIPLASKFRQLNSVGRV